MKGENSTFMVKYMEWTNEECNNWKDKTNKLTKLTTIVTDSDSNFNKSFASYKLFSIQKKLDSLPKWI